MSIPKIDIGIKNIDIRDIQVNVLPEWIVAPPSTMLPVAPPVVSGVGVPIVNIPGCVEAHIDSNENQTLKDEDKDGVRTFCDAGTPSFNPIDYDANRLVIESTEPPLPKISPPPPEDTSAPAAPSPQIPKRPSCGLDEKYNESKKVCEKIVEEVGEPPAEEIPWTEKYLPAPEAVTTTAAIAVVATTSALLAKPLADLLLKVVKPVVKKVLKKVATLRGKKIPVQSKAERLAEQRQRNEAVKKLRSVRPLKK